MDKRYQVFVSSTFEDLRLERQAVMQALLELECIPAGMELFTASDDEAWKVITRVIDECDYYVVILAGRYGSVDADGISFTEKEYRYALDQGKPVIGFFHENPGKISAEHCESDPAAKEQLEKFRELIKGKLCKPWSDASDLGLKVTQAVNRLIKDRPAVGWVRADQVPEASATAEILRLRERVEELEGQVADVANRPPPGTDPLAQGNETIEISYVYTASMVDKLFETTSRNSKCPLSWDAIFAASVAASHG